MSQNLTLERVGPIVHADVNFGDLTVFVGPQATGKSVLLQFLKLMLDSSSIFHSLKKYGLDWEKKWPEFFNLYFGEGMQGIWGADSRVSWNGEVISIPNFVRPKKGRAKEKTFFIPAQRVLALSRDGWLRPFGDYKAGDPFTVRDFSEKLRLLMESGLGKGDALFPQAGRLKVEIRKMLDAAVFSGFRLSVERQGPQKRLVLSGRDQKSSLPFMVWSAGQREFVPLLLGLYWLMPPTSVKKRGSTEWVVVEELEMGLHPKAIAAVLVIVLDLLWRGYRVCLSTHSPHVLDLLWALRVFRDHNAKAQSVLRLFGARETPGMLEVAKEALRKTTTVYYFDPKTHTAHDISNLDPSSPKAAEAGWGGLTEFSGRVNEEVARVAGSAR